MTREEILAYQSKAARFRATPIGIALSKYLNARDHVKDLGDRDRAPYSHIERAAEKERDAWDVLVALLEPLSSSSGNDQ